MRTVTTIGVMLAGLVALAPGRADACVIKACERILDIELAYPGPIPFGDGAIALRPKAAELLDGGLYFSIVDALPAMTVSVAPAKGGPSVPGELVAIAELDLYVWRPSAPLSPLTEYELKVAVDNTTLDHPDCGPDEVVRTFMVSTSEVDAAPLTAPALMISAEVVLDPVLQWTTMVCCDDLVVIEDNGECGGVGVFVLSGICSPGAAIGGLSVKAALDMVEVAAAQGQVGYVFDGELFALGASEATLLREQPFCASLAAIHLKTGEKTLGPEVCVGEDLKDMLGEQPIDPTPGLMMCVGQPFTCALGEDELSWDMMNCTPWPEGQETTGGEGSTGAETSTTTEASTGGASSTGGDPTSTTSDPTSTTGDPTTQGVTSEPSTTSGAGEGSSGGDTSAGGSGDAPGQVGCGCASGEGAAPWGVLVIAGLLRRRRRAEVT